MAFAQDQQLVCGGAWEDFAGAIGPVDGDVIDLCSVTEAEVECVFAGGLVAAATVEEGDLLKFGGGDGHDSADGSSLAAIRQQGSNLQPVAVCHFVFHQDWGLVEAGDEQVEVAIAIDITCRQASRDSVE